MPSVDKRGFATSVVPDPTVRVSVFEDGFTRQVTLNCLAAKGWIQTFFLGGGGLPFFSLFYIKLDLGLYMYRESKGLKSVLFDATIF